MPHAAGADIKEFLAVASDPKKYLQAKEALDERTRKAHAAEQLERTALIETAKVLKEVNEKSEKLATDTLVQAEEMKVREEAVAEREKWAKHHKGKLDDREAGIVIREAESAEKIGQAEIKLNDDRHAFQVDADKWTSDINEYETALMARESDVTAREKAVETKETVFKNRILKLNRDLI